MVDRQTHAQAVAAGVHMWLHRDLRMCLANGAVSMAELR